MRLLWLTWKDREHPAAGGAESVNELLARGLAARGHDVEFVVAGFPGGAATAARDGFRITRLGNRWTVYWRAFRHYRAHGRDRYDLIIDECNTVPFFSNLYAREPVAVFAHQLARQVWFYEMPWPVAAVGYLLEPLYLRLLLRMRPPAAIVAVSESSRRDLVRHGADPARISVIPQGLAEAPPTAIGPGPDFERPVMLSLGASRAMKRGPDVIRAFEIAKASLPSLRLIVAGAFHGPYGPTLRQRIERSPYRADIEIVEHVDEQTRPALLQRVHLLCAASVKEGWGLVVSEAAAQGVPAVAYDVDGLRDSVQDGVTGIVTRERTPAAMAAAVVRLLHDRAEWERMRQAAWQGARRLTPEASVAAFEAALLSAASKTS